MLQPQSGWDPSVPGIWEGDTPSFLHLVSAVRGLNDPGKPDQPGEASSFATTHPKIIGLMIQPAGRQCRSGASMFRRISPVARTGCCREREPGKSGAFDGDYDQAQLFGGANGGGRYPLAGPGAYWPPPSLTSALSIMKEERQKSALRRYQDQAANADWRMQLIPCADPRKPVRIQTNGYALAW